MTINIIWLLGVTFTNIIFDLDSALHVEYSDAVLCGAFVDINNYPMDGLATISNLTSLSRNLNYKQTQQIMPIWNGFHLIIFLVGEVDLDTCMIYLLLMKWLLNGFHLR